VPGLIGKLCVSRVERWRGGAGSGLDPYQGFPVCASISVGHTPFPPPAHQTGRADFSHPAFGQGLMGSPTEHCERSGVGRVQLIMQANVRKREMP